MRGLPPGWPALALDTCVTDRLIGAIEPDRATTLKTIRRVLALARGETLGKFQGAEEGYDHPRRLEDAREVTAS